MLVGFSNHDPAMDARLERHPIEDIEPEPQSDFTRMADLLSSVLVWLAESKSRNVSGLRNQNGTRRYFSASKVNLRTVAFIYAVRPDLVGSLRAIARHCDCSHEAIRKHVDDFRCRFGFRTAGQWTDEARNHLSKAVAESHHRHESVVQ